MSHVILKVHDASRQQRRLKKLLGSVALPNLVDLIGSVELEANPRLAKVGRVTDEIEESLANEGEIFEFMSKGILIAASEVEELERSRFRLTFDDPDLEGIVDGGHNSLAAGRYILSRVLTAALGEDEAKRILKTIKTWADLKAAWSEHESLLKAHKADIPEVLMPIEIISPSDEDGGYEYFQDKVLIINSARNNNAELRPETKANKRGFYSEIRGNLDDELVNAVEWKTNDGGRVKVRELVALALVPLAKLEFETMEQVRKSPTVIFSSKGQCVKIYNTLMEKEEIVTEVKGDIVKVNHAGVKSALAMMKDLPRLYDWLYENFPDAYNEAGGKFGKIKSVSISNGTTYRSKFYKLPVQYSYGEGYIYPLLWGLSALMKVQGGEVAWITDPFKFLERHFDGMMKSFYAMIQGQNFDPAKVGKAGGAYNLARDLVSAAYKDDLLKLHGLN